MEKNDFLLYNEIIYRLHACQTMEEFKPTLLAQLKLMLPYTYGSFITIQTDPETRELIHRDPYCRPREFEEGERGGWGASTRATPFGSATPPSPQWFGTVSSYQETAAFPRPATGSFIGSTRSTTAFK